MADRPLRPDAQEAESAISLAARQTAEEVLSGLGSVSSGLTAPEAARRLAVNGPNIIRTHRASGDLRLPGDAG